MREARRGPKKQPALRKIRLQRHEGCRVGQETRRRFIRNIEVVDALYHVTQGVPGHPAAQSDQGCLFSLLSVGLWPRLSGP